VIPFTGKIDRTYLKFNESGFSVEVTLTGFSVEVTLTNNVVGSIHVIGGSSYYTSNL